jgi:molecular chaperone DnaJ
MRLPQDYYEVLGVTRGATDDEIKKAFRGLARSLHPDVGPGGEQFHAVLTAYHVLSHPKRRRLYDRLGIRPKTRPAPAVPPIELALEWWEAERGASTPVQVDEPADCPDCLGRGIPRGVSPALCIVCHGLGRVNRVTETSELRLLEVNTCSACDGWGQDRVDPCPTCGGSGKTSASVTIHVRTPPGVRDGDVLQVDGVAPRFVLSVSARPRDSRLVLAVSALALLAALVLLVVLLLR